MASKSTRKALAVISINKVLIKEFFESIQDKNQEITNIYNEIISRADDACLTYNDQTFCDRDLWLMWKGVKEFELKYLFNKKLYWISILSMGLAMLEDIMRYVKNDNKRNAVSELIKSIYFLQTVLEEKFNEADHISAYKEGEELFNNWQKIEK